MDRHPLFFKNSSFPSENGVKGSLRPVKGHCVTFDSSQCRRNSGPSSARSSCRAVRVYVCPAPLRHLWAELFALKGLLYTLFSYVQKRQLSLTYFFALNPAVPMVLLCDFGKVSKKALKDFEFRSPAPQTRPGKTRTILALSARS